MRRFLACLFLLATIPAGQALAQCRGANGINTIDSCPAAVSPQPTDETLLYQTGQSPSTRKATILQMLSVPGSPQYVPFGGGTFTGPVTLAQDPTTTFGAATKHYVDTAPFVPTNGGTFTGAIAGVQYGVGAQLRALLTLTRANGGNQDTPLATFSYTSNFADGPQTTFATTNLNTTVAGDTVGNGPAGNFYSLSSSLTASVLRSTVATAAGSQNAGIYSAVTKNMPPNGIPAGRRMADGWLYSGLLTDTTNTPSSQSGMEVGGEFDLSTNNLDDLGGRSLLRASLTQNTSSGYSTGAAYGLYLGNTNASFWDGIQNAGTFSQAGLDLRSAATYQPQITSATPGGNVQSVTVDNVLPLASGGAAGSLPLASTVAITGISALSAGSGSQLTVSAVSALAVGMYAYDLTTPSAIPGATVITLINGNTLSFSASTTVANGDTLLFGRGQKTVAILGTSETIAGVSLSGQSSTAGTVWFTSPIPAAQAANGNRIAPNAHTIWLWEGAAGGTPTGDIAFNRSGTMTLACNSLASCTGLTTPGTFSASAFSVGGTQVVGAHIGGWGAGSNGSRAALNGSTATLAQTSAAVAQLIADLTTHGLIGP